MRGGELMSCIHSGWTSPVVSASVVQLSSRRAAQPLAQPGPAWPSPLSTPRTTTSTSQFTRLLSDWSSQSSVRSRDVDAVKFAVRCVTGPGCYYMYLDPIWFRVCVSVSWWRCVTLCTSGFGTDVMFAYNRINKGANGVYSKWFTRGHHETQRLDCDSYNSLLSRLIVVKVLKVDLSLPMSSR